LETSHSMKQPEDTKSEVDPKQNGLIDSTTFHTRASPFGGRSEHMFRESCRQACIGWKRWQAQVTDSDRNKVKWGCLVVFHKTDYHQLSLAVTYYSCTSRAVQ
jgi:hypothetical protein